jgi:hypothetical protein
MSILQEYSRILDFSIEQLEEVARNLGVTFSSGIHADSVTKKMRMLLIHPAGLFVLEQQGAFTETFSFSQFKLTDKSTIPAVAWAEFLIGFQTALMVRKEFEAQHQSVTQTFLETVLSGSTSSS